MSRTARRLKEMGAVLPRPEIDVGREAARLVQPTAEVSHPPLSVLAEGEAMFEIAG